VERVTGPIDTEDKARTLARAILADARRSGGDPLERERNIVAGRDLFRERVTQGLRGIYEFELAQTDWASAVAAEPVAQPPAPPAPAPVPPPTAGLAPHVCPNCGAPMPVGMPGSIQHCRFCTAETREPHVTREPWRR
jgi:hypothetical protein